MSPEEMTQKAVDYLNRALGADKATIEAIMNYRIPCNEKLANDPHFIVWGVAHRRLHPGG